MMERNKACWDELNFQDLGHFCCMGRGTPKILSHVFVRKRRKSPSLLTTGSTIGLSKDYAICREKMTKAALVGEMQTQGLPPIS